MIVDPDFLDHWKTRMLVAALGDDELAPVYVLRLWAHCQNRRMWVFDLPAMALKGICRFQGDAIVFEEAMIASGFVARNGQAITVVGWEEYNAALIAAWTNGGKGGRPKKEPTENPRVNQKDNPLDTQGKPVGDPIRGDEIGIDKKSNSKAETQRATRLPTDWQPSDEDIEFCKTSRPDLHFGEVSARFRDYWHGIGGQKGCKLDWSATWRNWVRNEKQIHQARASPGQGHQQLGKAGQVTAANAQRLIEKMRLENEQSG